MTDPVNAHTLLSISGQGVAPYSARGLSQSLDPIQQASNSRRTINGDLKDLSFDGFKKYKSTITANDQTAPAFAELWPGETVTVDCAAELCYLTAGGSPKRTVVAGSSRTEGLYTFYRPQLVMKVMGYSVNAGEYDAAVAWSMQLEEI